MINWNDYIERYRQGQLSPSEMHDLEKRALNDPFLEDALDGARQQTPSDYLKDIDYLRSQILKKEAKKAWVPLRIAATVLLLVGLSFIIYFLSNAPIEKEGLISQNQINPAPAPFEMQEKQVDSIPDNDFLAPGKPKEKELDAKTVLKATTLSSGNEHSDHPYFAGEIDDKMEGSEIERKGIENASQAGLQRSLLIDSVSSRKMATDHETITQLNTLIEAPGAEEKKTIRGQVTSVDEGSPLTGVHVTLKGGLDSALTDEHGNYSISLPNQKNKELVFFSRGFQSKEVSINNRNHLNIQLNKDIKELNEIRAAGYVVAPSDSGKPIPDSHAEPIISKSEYKKYLESNLQYPIQAKEKKAEGEVIIEFTVTANGMLSDFKVIKDMSWGCNEEVIRLVKEGPKWNPAKQESKMIDSQARVSVLFELPK
jgi:TonB family protein